MRVVFTYLVIVIILGWFGFELRKKDKSVSNALFGLAALLTVLFVVVLITGEP